MKKFIVIACGLLIVASCNKVKSVKEKISEVKTQTDDLKTTVNYAKTLTEQMDTIEDEITRLSELEPISNESLKAWMPVELGGFNRTSYKIGELKMGGISSIEAKFSHEKADQSFSIQLIDGAGGGTLYLAGLRMGLQMEMEEETEQDFRRTVERNGIKAIEEGDKEGGFSKIQFIESQRFYVELTGENMTLEELWGMVQRFKFEQLQ